VKGVSIILKVSCSIAAVAVGFVCLAGFKGNSTAAVAGTYDLKLSDEAVSLCEWLQASVPAGRLVLSEDGEYRLERYIEGRRMISEGEFEVDRSELVLNRNNTRKTLRGNVSRNRVTIEGLAFEREGFAEDVEVETRREPPVRELPRQEPVRREIPREIPRETPREVERPQPRAFSAVGRWIVQNSNGRVDPSIHFTFTQDGRFSFSGMGGTSSGTYEVIEDRISLRYQEVDGQKVEFPYNGRAYVTGDGFRIDNFRYVRD
jgi:hypothetical protein